MNPIHYQASELWQNLVDQDTGAIYQKALHKTVQLFKQLSRFLLLLLLLVTAVVVWVWSVGFQSGSGFRIWLKEHPDPSALALKTVEVLLYPFRVASIWLEKQAKELFGWDLKLTELLPPEPQTQISNSSEQRVTQGNVATASLSDSVKPE
jgi:hypothetical protein